MPGDEENIRHLLRSELIQFGLLESGFLMFGGRDSSNIGRSIKDADFADNFISSLSSRIANAYPEGEQGRAVVRICSALFDMSERRPIETARFVSIDLSAKKWGEAEVIDAFVRRPEAFAELASSSGHLLNSMANWIASQQGRYAGFISDPRRTLAHFMEIRKNREPEMPEGEFRRTPLFRAIAASARLTNTPVSLSPTSDAFSEHGNAIISTVRPDRLLHEYIRALQKFRPDIFSAKTDAAISDAYDMLESTSSGLSQNAKAALIPFCGRLSPGAPDESSILFGIFGEGIAPNRPDIGGRHLPIPGRPDAGKDELSACAISTLAFDRKGEFFRRLKGIRALADSGNAEAVSAYAAIVSVLPPLLHAGRAVLSELRRQLPFGQAAPELDTLQINLRAAALLSSEAVVLPKKIPR